jgi:hypothetical protein
MKRFLTIAASCLLGLPLLQGTSPAHGQGSASVGPDTMKTMLLRPGGWKAEWIEVVKDDKGVSEIVFEDRGDKVVAKMRNITVPATCEREVTIAPKTVKFDGCYDWAITLAFDPSDPDYPFKGTSGGKGYKYKLRANLTP